jgi:ABC-2 type transport system ATP-binding protein
LAWHSALAVDVSGLVKTFGETTAVDGVDLAVAPGMVYGLLGPNGAGKTTINRVRAPLLRPDAGTARVLGHDVVAEADAVRGRVALTGQYASVDEDLTGWENLVLLAGCWASHTDKPGRGPASCWTPSGWPRRAAGR